MSVSASLYLELVADLLWPEAGRLLNWAHGRSAESCWPMIADREPVSHGEPFSRLTDRDLANPNHWFRRKLECLEQVEDKMTMTVNLKMRRIEQDG